MEKWIEIRKGGNFMEMAKKYGIDLTDCPDYKKPGYNR